MPRYRYTHNISVVFSNIDGHNWVPNPGEEIETLTPVNHPYLQLVDDVPEIEVKTESPVKQVVATDTKDAASGEIVKES